MNKLKRILKKILDNSYLERELTEEEINEQQGILRNVR